MFVVCCQVEVSATSWSLAQSNSTDSGASSCVITKPSERGSHSPRWAAESEKNNNLYLGYEIVEGGAVYRNFHTTGR
jgi:hypothetical protein